MASQTADLSLDSTTEVHGATAQARTPTVTTAAHPVPASSVRAIISAIAMPMSAAIALAVHFWVANSEPTSTTNYYGQILLIFLGLALVLVAGQFISKSLRAWL